MIFKVGDKVKWSSQAAGHAKEKVGVVVKIQASMELLDSCWRSSHKLRFDSLSRPGESCLVEISRGPKAKPALYWPEVSKLRLVELEIPVLSTAAQEPELEPQGIFSDNLDRLTGRALEPKA